MIAQRRNTQTFLQVRSTLQTKCGPKEPNPPSWDPGRVEVHMNRHTGMEEGRWMPQVESCGHTQPKGNARTNHSGFCKVMQWRAFFVLLIVCLCLAIGLGMERLTKTQSSLQNSLQKQSSPVLYYVLQTNMELKKVRQDGLCCPLPGKHHLLNSHWFHSEPLINWSIHDMGFLKCSPPWKTTCSKTS